MIIDTNKCIGCGICIPFCPVNAISIEEKKGYVDLDACVECGSCLRQKVCVKDAFVQQTLAWPRYVRAIFSNVKLPSPNTNVPGRGTEEMKTNDVTGRFPPGSVGVALELGRPGCGTSMHDVELLAKTVVANGGKIEKDNPTTFLFESLETGVVKKEFLGERAMSVIVEALTDREGLVPMLLAIKEVEPQIKTVFSVDIISMLEDGEIPTTPILEAAGIAVRPNGKTCLGIGRPRKEF